MESILGRNLLTEEHVHHIDFDKQNNSPENLFLFISNNFHKLYHGYIKNHKYISPDVFMKEHSEHYIKTVYNYDWLYKQYITLNKSIKSISEDTEVSRTCITYSLKDLHIYELRKPTINQFI